MNNKNDQDYDDIENNKNNTCEKKKKNGIDCAVESIVLCTGMPYLCTTHSP